MMNSLVVNKINYFVIVSLFLIGCTRSSRVSVGEFDRTVTISKNIFVPNDIKQILLKQLSDIEIVTKQDYSTLFWDFYDDSVIPNECFTDINNDQIMDYALLVKQNKVLKVAVVYSTANGYSYWISPFSLETIDVKGINFNLTIKPAGRTDVVKKVPESLVLKKNTFLLNQLEQDYLMLYENDGKILTFKML